MSSTYIVHWRPMWLWKCTSDFAQTLRHHSHIWDNAFILTVFICYLSRLAFLIKVWKLVSNWKKEVCDNVIYFAWLWLFITSTFLLLNYTFKTYWSEKLSLTKKHYNFTTISELFEYDFTTKYNPKIFELKFLLRWLSFRQIRFSVSIFNVIVTFRKSEEVSFIFACDRSGWGFHHVVIETGTLGRHWRAKTAGKDARYWLRCRPDWLEQNDGPDYGFKRVNSD